MESATEGGGRVNRCRGNGIELRQQLVTGPNRGAISGGKGQGWLPCEKKHKVLYMG
jgi:hypothetical protein